MPILRQANHEEVGMGHMTDEQKAVRMHYHMYDSLEGIEEHARRIVALEELAIFLREALGSSVSGILLNNRPEERRLFYNFDSAFEELGIEEV